MRTPNKECNNKLYWKLRNLGEEAGKDKRVEIKVIQWSLHVTTEGHCEKQDAWKGEGRGWGQKLY